MFKKVIQCVYIVTVCVYYIATMYVCALCVCDIVQCIYICTQCARVVTVIVCV